MQDDFALLAEDVSSPFDGSRFAIGRRPVRVGTIDLDALDAETDSCLDMLVKLPGGDVRLPEAFRTKAVFSLFTLAAEMEKKLPGPGWCDHYLYLTVDQREVLPGRSHRNAGWHFDGMQGSRYFEKLTACRQYVVSSANPTEYATLPTNADGLTEDGHNWFVELGAQIDESIPGAVVKGAPGEVMLMSAYQLHRSPVSMAEHPYRRTFFRLDVSMKQQDRLGNSLNPDLPAPFEFQPRGLPEGLRYEISDSGWEGGRKFSKAVL
jgi:hypothetical protein